MGSPWDVIFQCKKDAGRGRPQDVGMEYPLVLHKGPYGDVHRASFGDIGMGLPLALHTGPYGGRPWDVKFCRVG